MFFGWLEIICIIYIYQKNNPENFVNAENILVLYW